MEIPLGKGVFLIATPALRDPNFRQTVILLCEHGPEGALGVVLNRPDRDEYYRGFTPNARVGRPTPSSLLRRARAKR